MATDTTEDLEKAEKEAKWAATQAWHHWLSVPRGSREFHKSPQDFLYEILADFKTGGTCVVTYTPAMRDALDAEARRQAAVLKQRVEEWRP